MSENNQAPTDGNTKIIVIALTLFTILIVANMVIKGT